MIRTVILTHTIPMQLADKVADWFAHIKPRTVIFMSYALAPGIYGNDMSEAIQQCNIYSWMCIYEDSNIVQPKVNINGR